MNDTPRVSVAWQVSTDPRMGAIGNWIPQPAGASASVQRARESTLRRASAGTDPTPLIRRNHSVSVGTKSYPVTVAGSLGDAFGRQNPRGFGGSVTGGFPDKAVSACSPQSKRPIDLVERAACAEGSSSGWLCCSTGRPCGRKGLSLPSRRHRPGRSPSVPGRRRKKSRSSPVIRPVGSVCST